MNMMVLYSVALLVLMPEKKLPHWVEAAVITVQYCLRK